MGVVRGDAAATSTTPRPPAQHVGPPQAMIAIRPTGQLAPLPHAAGRHPPQPHDNHVKSSLEHATRFTSKSRECGTQTFNWAAGRDWTRLGVTDVGWFGPPGFTQGVGLSSQVAGRNDHRRGAGTRGGGHLHRLSPGSPFVLCNALQRYCHGLMMALIDAGSASRAASAWWVSRNE